MRLFTNLGLVAVLALASPALAQTPRASSMGLAVGNTTQAVYEGGETVTLKLKADGTFTMTVPDGTPRSGDWLADARHVCMIVKQPAPTDDAPRARCEAAFGEDKAFGESWKVTDSYGDPVTITIRQGQ